MIRLEELILKEIDGELTRREARELKQLLQSDSAARVLYRQLLTLEVELRNLDEQMDVSDAVMEFVRLPRKSSSSWKPAPAILDSLDRFFFRFVLPLGVVASFLTAYFVLQSTHFDRTKLAEIEGSLQIVRNGRMKSLSRGIGLQPGDRIVTLPGSGAELRYRDHTVVKLFSGAQVNFESSISFEEPYSKSMELLAGRIDAEVARQPEGQPFVIQTPHALAIVRGTRFSLSTDKQQTRLEVRQGRVDFRSMDDGSTSTVDAGKVALAKPALSPARSLEGLIAYYTFQTGKGNQVLDRSGFGDPLHLRLETSREDSVSWRSDQGIRFLQRARLQSKPAGKIVTACKRSKALTVEAWIHPAKTDQSGPARIVTLSKGSSVTNFTLGQQGNHFVVRTATSKSSSELEASRFLIRTKLTHLVLTVSPHGNRCLWIDGKPMAQDRVGVDFSKWSPNLCLGLADDPSGENRFWQGTFHLVAIYARALSEQEISRHYSVGPTPLSGPK